MDHAIPGDHPHVHEDSTAPMNGRQRGDGPGFEAHRRVGAREAQTAGEARVGAAGAPYGPLAPFTSYRQLIFDCDGVIVDSNGVKEANIRAAAESVCKTAEAARFVAYFVANNGLPRDTKIARFFPDPDVRRAVLSRYNELNAASVPFVEPEPAACRFLKRCAGEGVPLYLVSGGDEPEVRELLENAGIAGFFEKILGGPSSKVEHLEHLGLAGPTCYFGDSRYDHEVASRFGFDFVFLSRYSQFSEWREYFSGRPEVRVVPDFRSLE
jgi:phosphoglycolate phosphatase-like HAD superfamily hydrolase